MKHAELRLLRVEMIWYPDKDGHFNSGRPDRLDYIYTEPKFGKLVDSSGGEMRVVASGEESNGADSQARAGH